MRTVMDFEAYSLFPKEYDHSVARQLLYQARHDGKHSSDPTVFWQSRSFCGLYSGLHHI